MKKGIAFFDFDGTITTKDTLLEFIKFARGGLRFWSGFLLHAPWLVAMKLGLMDNQAVKEKVLRFFFKGTGLDEFERCCQNFYRQRLPSLLRPGAIAEIEKLKTEGKVVVIVSASPENWIQPFAGAMDVELIASRLEVVNGAITGRIIGKNCRGPEKVNRIKERYHVNEYAEIYAYGDTSGDRDMLTMATNAFYKPFRK